MLIPIGTDVQHRRQPFVTYLIIGLNLLIFAMQWAVERSGGSNSQTDLIRFIANLESNLANLSCINWIIFRRKVTKRSDFGKIGFVVTLRIRNI